MMTGQQRRNRSSNIPTPSKLQRPKFSQRRKQKQQQQHRSNLFSIKNILIGILLLFLIWVTIFFHLHSKLSSLPVEPNQSSSGPNAPKQQQQQKSEHLDSQGGDNRQDSKEKNYKEWRQIAMDIAGLSTPKEMIQYLQEHDPFGVRVVEQRLLQAESSHHAGLTVRQLLSHKEGIFTCPPLKQRLTYPDRRNMTKAEQFKNNPKSKTFLFFQHLRKAGGTNFCTMAKDNLPRPTLPHYYCMPDYGWTSMETKFMGEKKVRPSCAGCLQRYTNEEITANMPPYKIAGNEWDAFRSDFVHLDAVFAISFRKPLDRALSQFRFECIEDRGCKIKNITQWWDRRKDLYNVYTWTLSNVGLGGILATWSGPHETSKRRQLMGTAVDILTQFHIVLVMEWLAYAQPLVQDILGFTNIKALTKRVRPHAVGAMARLDGQDVNAMGASGITKASWDPKTYLSGAQYREMQHWLAMDEILNDVARRIFLERLACQNEQE